MSSRRRLGMAEAIEALREELTTAMHANGPHEVNFPIENIEISINIAIARSGDADARVSFWVIEAGSSGSWSKEEIQTITLTLGRPVNRYGGPIEVHEASVEKP